MHLSRMRFDLPILKRHGLLLLLTSVAVVVGTGARFKGLGTWPLGVDEYYFARSVQNLLRFGLPAYECGGFYVRGLLLQYLSAGLQVIGFSAELAPRLISALTGLLALPAAFLLGRRLNGTAAGLIVVSLLAVSVWQIEMGRFGRFYAPFQAIFLCYLVCFIRYSVDGCRYGAWGMGILAVLSVLVWEGGALLTAINLLPALINHDRGRLTASQWRYVLVMGILMLLVYGYQQIDFRVAQDALPKNFEDILAAANPGPHREPGGPMAFLKSNPEWLLIGLLPLGASIWALRHIVSYRDQWLTGIGLLAAFVAALLGQALAFVSIITVLILTRLLDWSDLFCKRGMPYLAASLLAISCWVAVSLLQSVVIGESIESYRGTLSTLIYQIAGFPNVIDMIARPWGRAVPILGLSLFSMLAFSVVWAISSGSSGYKLERTLLVVTIVLILMVGAAPSPRLETRYTFFLYPLLLINAVVLILRVVPFAAGRFKKSAVPGITVIFGWFAMTEDFNLRHLATIDSKETTFRIGMDPDEASHLYPRSDIRAAAEWLRSNASLPGDLIISGPGIASLDFYYTNIDFVYVDPSDQRLGNWSCRGGTVERWTNLPLLYSFDELSSRIAASQRSFLVIDRRLADQFLARLANLEPRVVWENSFGSHTIVVFNQDPFRTMEATDEGVTPASLP